MCTIDQSGNDFPMKKTNAFFLCVLFIRVNTNCLPYFWKYLDSLAHKILRLKLLKHLFQAEHIKGTIFSGVAFHGALHLVLVLPLFFFFGSYLFSMFKLQFCNPWQYSLTQIMKSSVIIFSLEILRLNPKRRFKHLKDSF